MTRSDPARRTLAIAIPSTRMNSSPPVPVDDHARHPAGIQVLSRATQLLRAIRQSAGGITQAELATRLALPRSTVSRILGALEADELVAATGGKYRVGAEFTRLASAGVREIASLIHPRIVELSRSLTETVDVSVLDGGGVRFVDQVDAPHRLRAASAVGELFPLHTCAPGKAMLATLTEDELDAILPSRLPASTEYTVTSRDVLLEQLAGIRETGVAYDYEEQNDGICAVGVALRVDGVLVAVSVPVPAQRFARRESDCAAALLAFRAQVETDHAS